MPRFHQRPHPALQWYREHGIFLHEQGGGPKGALIVTRDQPDGGIDSALISALIAKVGGR